MRNLVFISHANPDQNEFARWLGLQLTNSGYLVWSDVTRLIGGEYFWADIEDAIRQHTAKFLFVLSRASNVKPGTLDELHLAKSVAKTESLNDFVIPLRVDDLPFSEINVAIHRVNTIDFAAGWAEGLSQVLTKLEKDGIPKNANNSNPSAVSLWWKSHVDGSEIVQQQTESLVSNWFAIRNVPDTIHIHVVPSAKGSDIRQDARSFPSYSMGGLVVSFATADELGLAGAVTNTTQLQSCLKVGTTEPLIGPREFRNGMTSLLQQAWLQFLRARQIPFYEMANARQCAYFVPDMFESRLQSFAIADLVSGRRSLVGRSKETHWHFGISADVQLDPVLAYVIRAHVLFSDDGHEIWSSPKRMHRARRSVCKDWWNPHWRDRLLASMQWLTEGHDQTELLPSLSPNQHLQIPIRPITFDCPVSYDEASISLPDDAEDDFDADFEITDVDNLGEN